MATNFLDRVQNGLTLVRRPGRAAGWAQWLRQLGVAVLYLLLARLALAYFAPDGVVGIFWPASGLALAAVLLGGKRYAAGVFLGAALSEFVAGHAAWMALAMACGATLAALLGAWLLQRDARFDAGFRTLRDYLRLMLLAGLVSTSVSALIGVTVLHLAGHLTLASYLRNLLHWWMGDALGVVLVTPLFLIWRQTPVPWPPRERWPEIVLMLGLAFLTGQVIFLDWLPDTVGLIVDLGYWMFLFVIWAAIRLGSHGVILLLCMAAVQAQFGSHLGVGFLAHGMPKTQLINAWFYLMSLCFIGMALATYFAERKRSEATLRIAAIAFECQEGMIVTDARQGILRVNSSFSRIMGYTEAEVLGKSTALMRSDRHDDAFYDAIWAESMRAGSWQGEIWHRRKNGEVFPQWVTSTGVKDEDGRITHFVVTHVDITDQKQQEAKRLAHEAAHREALVREVHHRIKNNLQGITGMLRQFVHKHPETAEPLNQAIQQVSSIAVIHGLQGRASLTQVRLCELTGAIAGEIASLWQTPIDVVIPPVWMPCLIAELEAVPIALVLNELILNAVKHGGRAQGAVSVTLSKGLRADMIRVVISNSGRWPPPVDGAATAQTGLQLVDALMPLQGAGLSRQQQGNQVVTLLELEPPVLTLETKEPYEPA
jgi:PAS domain S-box-containing protein